MAQDEGLKKEGMHWYVVHTYAGLEGKAKQSLLERIKQYNMEAKFGEILIPTHPVQEIKSGVRTIQNKRSFPGYIIVQMQFDETTSHLVKNTPKISGFVGGGINKKPMPLREQEVEQMVTMATATPSKVKAQVDFSVGDLVKITDGPFANFSGNVEEVKAEKQRLRVTVSIFGRLTPVELDFIQVERLS